MTAPGTTPVYRQIAEALRPRVAQWEETRWATVRFTDEFKVSRRKTRDPWLSVLCRFAAAVAVSLWERLSGAPATSRPSGGGSVARPART
jgi:hypothetical protein